MAFFSLLSCSYRKSLAGMPLRRFLLATMRWATFLMTTKERWTCMLRPFPGQWEWTWLGSWSPGVGPSRRTLKRISLICPPGPTTPWPSITEDQPLADWQCRALIILEGNSIICLGFGVCPCFFRYYTFLFISFTLRDDIGNVWLLPSVKCLCCLLLKSFD